MSSENVIVIVTTLADWKDATVKDQSKTSRKNDTISTRQKTQIS